MNSAASQMALKRPMDTGGRKWHEDLEKRQFTRDENAG